MIQRRMVMFKEAPATTFTTAARAATPANSGTFDYSGTRETDEWHLLCTSTVHIRVMLFTALTLCNILYALPIYFSLFLIFLSLPIINS